MNIEALGLDWYPECTEFRNLVQGYYYRFVIAVRM